MARANKRARAAEITATAMAIAGALDKKGHTQMTKEVTYLQRDDG